MAIIYNDTGARPSPGAEARKFEEPSESPESIFAWTLLLARTPALQSLCSSLPVLRHPGAVDSAAGTFPASFGVAEQASSTAFGFVGQRAVAARQPDEFHLAGDRERH